MLDTLDQSELSQNTRPVYHQEIILTEKKVVPRYQITNVGLDQTRMIAIQPIGLLRSPQLSQTISEVENQSSQLLTPIDDPTMVENLTEDPKIAAARDIRIILLVKKYEGKSDREDNARLEILTQRLRRLSPVVTDHELTSATEIVDDLEAISSNLNKIRERYGLV